MYNILVGNCQLVLDDKPMSGTIVDDTKSESSERIKFIFFIFCFLRLCFAFDLIFLSWISFYMNRKKRWKSWNERSWCSISTLKYTLNYHRMNHGNVYVAKSFCNGKGKLVQYQRRVHTLNSKKSDTKHFPVRSRFVLHGQQLNFFFSSSLNLILNRQNGNVAG